MAAGVYLSILLYWGFGPTALPVAAAPAAEIEVFVRPGCPYCEAADHYLQELQRRRPRLQVRIRDVSRDAKARQELGELAHRSGIRPFGVPAFYLRGQLMIGFLSAETTGKAIEALLDQAPAVSERDSTVRSPTVGSVDVPLLGRLNVRDLGLPVFTIILGLLDGFNPCAM